ncbi:MAG TPA: methyltransferase [Kofleriaceae bacterium]|nr:methyltransferase [Kofleriaceae bacterium]
MSDLVDLTSAALLGRALYVAARLGVAEALRDGERPVDDLAAEVGADPGALYRLLRALARRGLFVETAGRRFALAARGRGLLPREPGSALPWILAMGELGWRSWGDLEHAVRTGGSAFAHVFGMSRYDYLRAHPEEGVHFDQAMTVFAEADAARIAASYPFAGLGIVVDVGGGQGLLLSRILDRAPQATGVLLERAEVIPAVEAWMQRRGLAGRCRCVAGDFFAAVPPGGDAYLLSSVLHNWNDADAARILAACRSAMAPGAVLLVIESPVPDDGGAAVTLLDLHMLAMHGGGERTEAEYRRLLAGAGFQVTRVIAAGEAAIIEAA